MTRGSPAVVELIIPVYNEAKVLETHLSRIIDLAKVIEPRYRLAVLVVDDGSTDATPALLARFCDNEPRARYLSFTRNFGKEAAIQAGLEHSAADAVILMDSDLQHPPELVPLMVSQWEAGNMVVEAVKAHRGPEGHVDRLLAGAFYRMMHLLAGLDLYGQSDYKLLDRCVIDQYLQMQERGRFFRGLVQWMNFPSARVPFIVAERPGGTSSWNWLKLLRYALRNITAFTAVPLQLVSWCGLFSLLVGVVFGTIALYQKWHGEALDGFTTVILLLIFFSGTLMLSLGVIGHYLACIYEEIKQRPHYVLRPRDAARPPDRPA